MGANDCVLVCPWPKGEESGDDIMAETGRDFFSDWEGEFEGDGLPNGLFRHFGPSWAGILIVVDGVMRDCDQKFYKNMTSRMDE
jgi:hypothetical protein